MKRYWKFILLITVIVLTFSTFYIHSSFATSKLPKFYIEDQSGNPEELKHLIIEGFYYDDQSEASLQISREGTDYDQPYSYLDMLKVEYYLQEEMIHLQKDYRSFMRNKLEGNADFFENDDIIAYANLDMDFRYIHGKSQHEFTFEIETLNKETKKQNKFTIPVPKPEDYDYLFVENVKMTDNNELKVFTRNSLRLNNDHHDEMFYYRHHDEIHVYTFDLSKQMLVNDEVIQQTEIESDHLSLDIFPLPDGGQIGPTEYIVFDGAVREVEMTEDGFMDEELLETKLIAYHVDSGEQKILELPAEINEEYHPFLYDKSTIYFEKYENNQYEIIEYNFVNEEIELKQTFDLKSPNHQNRRVEKIDDRVYILSSFQPKEETAYIQVGDMSTGSFLYEGTIEIDKDYNGKDYTLELYDIKITK